MRKTEKMINIALENILPMFQLNDIPVRIFGSVAIAIKCPNCFNYWDIFTRNKDELPPKNLDNEAYDLDLVSLISHRHSIKKIMIKAGFKKVTESLAYNAMYHRQLFYPADGSFPIEIYYSPLPFFHNLDVSKSITIESNTLTLTDLVLSKLQHQSLKHKQCVDLSIMLLDFDVRPNECNSISICRFSSIVKSDWKLKATIKRNLHTLNNFINEAFKNDKDNLTIIKDRIVRIENKINSIQCSSYQKILISIYNRFEIPLGTPITDPQPSNIKWR